MDITDKIYFDSSSALTALRCLLDMQKLESISNYGKIEDHPLSNRYHIENYTDKIDSTFYTDMATSILGRTISFLSMQDGLDYSGMFDGEINADYLDYLHNDQHDLLNNSEGEFGNFDGDTSLFDTRMGPGASLYAYYSEFQLVKPDERQDIIDRLNVPDNEFLYIVKKPEDINGVEMDFYYVGFGLPALEEQLLQHDYNTTFYSDRMPGNVMEAITSKYVENDIITVSERCWRSRIDGRFMNAVAYADWFNGCIVVRDNYFTDAIIHETGHLFDRTNQIDIGGGRYLDYDYMPLDLGTWDMVAETYADDIASIRESIDTDAGYAGDTMREYHYEFYAEAFRLYFYSEETRAALPEKVRRLIENEIDK